MSQTQNSVDDSEKLRIFVSYKRNSAPDEPVAKKLAAFLENQSFNVFIDQKLPVGERWAEEIETELSQSDFLVVLLSANSVNSQMVKGEITTAQRLYEEKGKPKILPIRLKYTEPFSYPLSAILDPINWSFWEKEADTEALFDEIKVAVNGGRLSIQDVSAKEALVKTDLKDSNGHSKIAQPLSDAQPLTGSLIPLGIDPTEPEDSQSGFYINRDSDSIALQIITGAKATINIKGPEQIGKSSLLFSTLAAAEQLGKKVAFIDFQLFDKAIFQDADKFYKLFCSEISREIGVENKTTAFWKEFGEETGNVHRATYYMRDHLLSAIGDSTLVLAIDEIESVFDLDFSDEFLLMLRTWHENRAKGIPATKAKWAKLNLVFAVSTDDLIKNKYVSPFNIGRVINIEDFNYEQIWELNTRHGYPLTEAQAEKLMQLVCGHPYLVRRALYSVATRDKTFDELVKTAADEFGPFGDHLRYHFFRLRQNPNLIAEMCQMIKNGKAMDRDAFYQLRGAGLVKYEFENAEFRCQLYKDFFKKQLL